MKQTMEVARGTLLCRRLGVLVAAAGLAVAGCANNASPAPAPPAVTSAPPTQPQPATLDWARSMCQSLQPAIDRLGAPPQPDLGNLAATRQVYIDYLGDARNAVQQAIDQLPSVGAPPVDNGQQVFDNMGNQLIQLREDLDEALTQLNRADPHDMGAIGPAVGAAVNVLGALGNRAQVLDELAVDPLLSAAVNQTPQCHNLTGKNTATDTNQPSTGSP
ncbi:MAG TPA: hypothetical protein VE709_12335 [Pseudonocardiaceae bacterium]|nr:hypothetical protein [Pseudonocardiaceae bacterium]